MQTRSQSSGEVSHFEEAEGATAVATTARAAKRITRSALKTLDRRAGDVQTRRPFGEDLHGDDLVHGDRHVPELLVAQDDEAVADRCDGALVEVRRLTVR